MKENDFRADDGDSIRLTIIHTEKHGVKDIFEESISELGVDVVFDENGICDFILQDAEGAEILVNIYKDSAEMALRISLMTSNDVPDDMPNDLFMEFANLAIEPLRDGHGAGIYPGSKKICFYKIVSLRNSSQGQLQSVLETLLNSVEEWDKKLAALISARG
jgi:hypothetical protein